MMVLNLLMGLLFLAALGYGVYLLWDSWRSSSPPETRTDDVVVPGGLGGSSMSEMNPVVLGALGLFGGLFLFFGLGKLEPYLVRAFRRNGNEIEQTDFAVVRPELRLQKVPVRRASAGSVVTGMFDLVPFVESSEEPTKTFNFFKKGKKRKKGIGHYVGFMGEMNRELIYDLIRESPDLESDGKGELNEIVEKLGKKMKMTMTKKQYDSLMKILEDGKHLPLKEAFEEEWNNTAYNERG